VKRTPWLKRDPNAPSWWHGETARTRGFELCGHRLEEYFIIPPEAKSIRFVGVQRANKDTVHVKLVNNGLINVNDSKYSEILTYPARDFAHKHVPSHPYWYMEYSI
jgi:hypothetical protein